VISYKRMSAEVKRQYVDDDELRDMVVELPVIRPQVRSDCEPCAVCQAVRDGKLVMLSPLPCGHKDDEVIWHSRPCVLVGCRQNLYLDITDNGSIKMTRPELEPEEMLEERSCVIDVANNGPLTLDDTGHVLDVSRERIRQLEVKALQQFKQNVEAAGISGEAIHNLASGEHHMVDDTVVVGRRK